MAEKGQREYFIFASLLFKTAYLLISNYGRKKMKAINE
jgi:hypothetical protein